MFLVDNQMSIPSATAGNYHCLLVFVSLLGGGGCGVGMFRGKGVYVCDFF